MIKYEILTLEFDSGYGKVVVHPLLIYSVNDVILCDAGFPNQIDQIETQLSKVGFTIKDLTKVFISHHDHDHLGSLAELKKRNPDMTVISSALEKPLIDGSEKSLRLSQAEAYNEQLTGDEKTFGVQFVGYLKTIQVCGVDQTVSDGDYIVEGVRVVSTPGHTPGHLSLYLEADKLLFAGDALAVENGHFVIANPEFTLDMATCMESIKKIQSLNPDQIVCYHGGSIDKNIKQMINDLQEGS